MKIPRFTISSLALLIGVVAVNLAVFRAVFPYGREATFEVVLAGVALQVAVFQTVRTRGRSRIFWVGFIVFGVLGVMTCVWPLYRPPTGYLSPLPAPNSFVFVEQTPASYAWTLWFLYAHSVFSWFRPLEASDVGCALVWFVPILSFSLAGGLLATMTHTPIMRVSSAIRRVQPTTAVQRGSTLHRPRITVFKVVAWLVLLAVNLAVARGLFVYDETLLYGLALMGLSLQVAVYRLFRFRGLTRAFWKGYVAFGLAASASLVWAFEFNDYTRLKSRRFLWPLQKVFMPGFRAIDSLQTLTWGSLSRLVEFSRVPSRVCSRV